jgi:large subunit ribosomal protein L7Ae
MVEVPKEMIERIYKLIESVKIDGKLRKGTNETTKAIEKGESQFAIAAEDTAPKEIVMHFPTLCAEKKIPFVYVPSKTELGAAAGLPVSTSAIAIVNPGDAKKQLMTIVKDLETLEEAGKAPVKEDKPAEKKEEPKVEEKPKDTTEETSAEPKGEAKPEEKPTEEPKTETKPVEEAPKEEEAPVEEVQEEKVEEPVAEEPKEEAPVEEETKTEEPVQEEKPVEEAPVDTTEESPVEEKKDVPEEDATEKDSAEPKEKSE